MKPISGKDLCRLLSAAGWSMIRIKGSHHIFTKLGERKVTTVPVHGNDDIKPDLATRIAKDSGISW